MNYNAFKNELRNYYSYLKSVDEIREEIELIHYEMTGVKGIRYDREPSSFNPELSEEKKLELIEEKEEKELELRFTLNAINLIEKKISKLSPGDKDACLKIIAEGISYEDVSRSKGYSKGGMWKRIRRELTKIL